MYLNEYLLKYCKDKNIQIIINNLSSAAIKISNNIRNIEDDSDKEKVNTKNFDGDTQKPLDILSDEILIDFLKKSPVSAYASEEQEGFVDFKNEIRDLNAF